MDKYLWFVIAAYGFTIGMVGVYTAFIYSVSKKNKQKVEKYVQSYE